jgi:hypothetical protein
VVANKEATSGAEEEEGATGDGILDVRLIGVMGGGRLYIGKVH